MTAPARLNNYPVLYSAANGEDTIVLVFREGHQPHPFVVAYWRHDLGTTWHDGNYCTDLPEALVFFQRRATVIGAYLKTPVTI